MSSFVPPAHLSPAANSQLVDVAGRQRMLNQVVCKLRFAKSLGEDTSPDKQRVLLEETARSLAYGGPIKVSLDPVQYVKAPRAGTNRILEAAEKQLVLLNELSSFDLELEIEPHQLLEDTEAFHQAAQETVAALTCWSKDLDRIAEEERENLVAGLKDLVGVADQGVETIQQTSGELSDISRGLGSITDNSRSNSQELLEASTRLSECSSSSASIATELVASVQEMQRIASSSARASISGVKTTEEANRRVDVLNSHTQSISKSIKEVSAVASQTRLLALNASIEAARVGEHGKGFGVVANEVKALADVAAQAADSIEHMTEDLNNAVGNVSSVVRDLINSMKDINQLAEETSVAAAQQATASAELARTATEVDSESRVVRTISQTAEEIASSSFTNIDRMQKEISTLSSTTNNLMNSIANGQSRIS